MASRLAVVEHRALDIECQPLGILCRGIRVLIFDDIAVGKIASDITGRPVFGHRLCSPVDGAGLKGFKGDIIIEVVVVA